MSFFDLVFITLQLFAGWGCFALARAQGVPGVIAAMVIGLVGAFFSLLWPPTVLQFLALLLLGLSMLHLKGSNRRFLIFGGIATVLSVLIPGVIRQRAWAALQEKYPVESLSERLAYETRDAETGHPALANSADDGAGLKTLPALEPKELLKLDEIYDGVERNYAIRRVRALQLVHASQVTQFMNDEGFGVSRMRPFSPSELEAEHYQPPVSLPVDENPASSVLSADASESTVGSAPLTGAAAGRVNDLHRKSLTSFANVRSFGDVQSRDRVVGFQSHGFRDVPGDDEGGISRIDRWKVSRVELVSLLKHAQPMVYVSKYLPGATAATQPPCGRPRRCVRRWTSCGPRRFDRSIRLKPATYRRCRREGI